MRGHRKTPHRCPKRPRSAGPLRVLLPLCIAVGFGACGGTPEAAAPPPPDVLVTDVVQKDVPIHSEWIGNTVGYVNADIRARVQGYLLSRSYTEGALVHTGDLLFTIDPRPYQAALDTTKGQLGIAEAQLTKTAQDVARYTPLAKEGAISQEELDNAVQANRAARAQVEAQRANVEQAKLNLGWTSITSPIDGIAGLAQAQVGDLIQPSTLMTSVSQLDPIQVNFPISEQEYLKFAVLIEQISKGEVRKDQRPLELILADGSVFPQPGKAALANRQVDVRTGTITIVSYFPNPGNLLRPGQFAKVRAVTDFAKNALLVPQRAVLEQQGQYLVAVVGADNKVDIHPVKVGERVGTDWIVTEGLKPGERVVAEGLQKLRAGITVNPKPFTASAPAAAQPGA
jgi:membrane fusion protein, multidrug efflux system